MGYCIYQEDAKFSMTKENCGLAFNAIKQACVEAVLIGDADRCYETLGLYLTDIDCFKSYQSLDDAMASMDWELSRSSDGDVYDITFIGEKSYNEDAILKIIAPFVDDGSFIEMRGGKGDIWRWTFNKGKMSADNARTTFSSDPIDVFITTKGGVIQDIVRNDYVRVILREYDVRGKKNGKLLSDKDGNKYIESVWNGKATLSKPKITNTQQKGV